MSTDHPTKFSVALVSMPWSIFNRPSIQLGSLKSYLKQHDPDLHVDCLHHYLKIAKEIGPGTYHWLTLSGWAGEALYSPVLFPGKKREAAELFEVERKRFKRNKAEPGFDFLYKQIDRALKDWVNSINWERYALVGFSVCFNQLLPSLAAAHLIKEKRPELRIVFGGSACGGQGGADLKENFSQVDHVIRGEGEKGLLDLVRNLQGLEDYRPEGVINCREYCDLKQSPAPDYQDYFNELATVFSDMPINPVIPIEFSRGCWWGKCSFCNLNLQWSGYRFKTAEQMFSEVEKIAAGFSCLDFSFTDNVLPVKEARNFFQKTASVQKDYGFFAEIRATQLDDLPLYSSGGMNIVQAGIEALSTSLLNKMNKGVSAIENLAVMKKARQEGILLEGNLIIEFPGSSEDEVQETLNCLEFAFPFQPLTTASFFLGLGSPVDCAPENFSTRAAGPHKNYYSLYPKEILANQRMLIKNHVGSKKIQKKLWRPVVEYVKKWQEYYRQRGNTSSSPLFYRDGGEFLVLRQEQINGTTLIHKLRGLSRRIYLYCEDIQALSEIEDEFDMVSREKLLQFLAGMVEKKLMFREGDRFISLAIRSRT